MLQSPRLEDNMNTIAFDQSLSNRPSVGQLFLNNIKIYTNMQVTAMTKNTAMVYTPEKVTYVITSLRITQTTVKKPSARKSVCLFTNIFDVKKKT